MSSSNKSSQSSDKSSWVILSIWLGTVIFGFAGIWWYKTRPGDVGTIQKFWPANSQLSLSPSAFTLVVFLHPKCDCSEATFSELTELLADTKKRIQPYLVFYRPEGKSEEWGHTHLWTEAKNSGLPVIPDEGGKLAWQFGARTSGQTYLFNTQGLLLFNGGITETRAHIGNNRGRRSITSIVNLGKVEVAATRAFGCSLFSASEYQKMQERYNHVNSTKY